MTLSWFAEELLHLQGSMKMRALWPQNEGIGDNYQIWLAQSLYVPMFSTRRLYHDLLKSYNIYKFPWRWGCCDLKKRALVTIIELDRRNHYMYPCFQPEHSSIICWRVIAFTRNSWRNDRKTSFNVPPMPLAAGDNKYHIINIEYKCI